MGRMAKYDTVKMAELVSVQDTGTELVLVFQGDVRVRISISGGRLVSDVDSG